MSAEYTSIYHVYEKPGKRRTMHARVVLIFAVSAIIINVLVLGMNCLLFFQGSVELPRNSNGAIVCLPCTKLNKDISNTDSLLAKLGHINDDGIHKCCAYDSQQLSTLLELVMEKPQPDPATLPVFNPRNFTFSPASAHKMLHPPNTAEKFTVPHFNDTLVKLHFEVKNEPFIEHIRNVKVHKLGLQIMYTGLYFVYSSIHFRPDSERPCKDFKYQTWGHYIEKVVINYPGRSGCLLKTSHTCCDTCTNDSNTRFTGGVFYLRAGDIIRVSVSGLGLVQFQKESSFAGLMMLGSGGDDDGVVPDESRFLR